MTRKNYCGNLLWQSSLTLLAPYVFGRKLFDKYDGKITLNEFCAAFNQLVAELPQALREASTNGGYNDLSSCGLCDEKTK